jgi:hypothetical protein
MEVCDIVGAEIDSKASARSGAFDAIVKADTGRVFHEEMSSRLAN